MGSWYEIGVLAGIGAAIGVLFVGVLAAVRVTAPAVVALVLAAAAAVAIGFAAGSWPDALAGGLGAIAGAAGTRQVVTGAVRRGGTPAGTALLVGLAAVVIAGLSFVPALGYLLALALPALGARLRTRATRRYAGLRILARD